MGRIKVILDEGMDYLMISASERTNILFEISKSLTAKSNKSKYINVVLDIEKCKLIGYRYIDEDIRKIYRQRIVYFIKNTSFEVIKKIASDILYDIDKVYLINMAYYLKICRNYDDVASLCENSVDCNENVMYLEKGLLDCLRNMIIFFEEILQSYNMKFINKPNESHFSMSIEDNVFKKNIIIQKYKKMYNRLINIINRFYDTCNSESVLILKFQIMSCMIEMNSIYCLSRSLNCGVNEESRHQIYNILSTYKKCISIIDNYLQFGLSLGIFSIDDIKKDISKFFDEYKITNEDGNCRLVDKDDVQYILKNIDCIFDDIREYEYVNNSLYAAKFED